MIKWREILMASFQKISVPVFVFLSTLIIYYACPIVTPYDSKWTLHTALSIVREGNTHLDEYKNLLFDSRGNIHYSVEEVKGHLYLYFPIGTTFLVTPFVFAADHIPWLKSYFGLDRIFVEQPLRLELFLASIMGACTSVFFFLISHKLTGKTLLALGNSFLFAFGTSAFSTASRGLWSHGPTIMLLSLVLYLILLAEEKPGVIPWAGFPLAFSYIVRPTNALSLFFLSLVILQRHRRYFLQFLGTALPAALLFLWHNFSVYGQSLPPYNRISRLGIHSHFWEALAGNLISPGRGLFVFSPFLLFVFAGIALKLRKKNWNLLDTSLIVILLLHWISISSLPHWWHGHSFGPRYFTDMLPYGAYFLCAWLTEKKTAGAWPRLWYFVFLALAFASLFIHAQTIRWDVFAWNVQPINVDVKPERIWDWSDLQFLRGL